MHQFISRFMRILVPGFWTIRLDRIAYSLVPDPNVTAKIQLNFKTLAGRSLQLRRISECGLGCYIRERNRIPDPLTVPLIPIPRLVIPDPDPVIPDPLYLVTVNKPTRVHSNSASIIDNIVTNRALFRSSVVKPKPK